MTDEPKHSPLPWTLADYGHCVVDADGNHVADDQDYYPTPVTMGDMALIARRVTEGPEVDEKLAISEEMAELLVNTVQVLDRGHGRTTCYIDGRNEHRLRRCCELARKFLEANGG